MIVYEFGEKLGMSDVSSTVSSKAEVIDDFQPVEVIEGENNGFVILICDHATNNLPAEYDSLGLTEDDLARHIAYDIGVRELTLMLAARLKLPAVLSNFSRLLIDPNRGEDDPTLVMQLSDGAVVPGNANIDSHGKTLRKQKYYDPYHEAISEAIRMVRESSAIPVLFSIHSFTPNWRGQQRVWHAGVLWDKDPRFAKFLIDSLAQDDSLVVGDNQPYSGALANDTLHKHGTSNGLPHALLEVRQDLIVSSEGIEIWCDKLAPILTEVISKRMFQEIRHYGSRAK